MAMAKLCFVEHFTLVAAVMEGQVFCDFLGQTLDVGPVRRAGHVEHKQVWYLILQWIFSSPVLQTLCYPQNKLFGQIELCCLVLGFNLLLIGVNVDLLFIEGLQILLKSQ